MKKALLLLPVVLVLLSKYFPTGDPVVLSASVTQRDVCAMLA